MDIKAQDLASIVRMADPQFDHATATTADQALFLNLQSRVELAQPGAAARKYWSTRPRAQYRVAWRDADGGEQCELFDGDEKVRELLGWSKTTFTQRMSTTRGAITTTRGCVTITVERVAGDSAPTDCTTGPSRPAAPFARIGRPPQNYHIIWEAPGDYAEVTVAGPSAVCYALGISLATLGKRMGQKSAFELQHGDYTITICKL